MRQGVHLITYADRLASTLPGVAQLLRGPLAGFAGVHLLPFYRPFDGVDAGFDPIDHTEVDARLGTWDDVRTLSAGLDVTADVIVNHISADSEPYRDWLEKGERSPHAGMFLTFGRVFPNGASEQDLVRIYRPRPGLPFTPVMLGDGSRRLVWTTFDSKQIDLDVTHPRSQRYLESILERLAAAGVGLVRLDAIGYAVKTPGTTSFLTPHTLAFIDALSQTAHRYGLKVLVELHSHYELQRLVAPHVDFVYDFGLPPLVLHALFTGSIAPLSRWLDLRPQNAVTVLDTHDGIGVIDVAREGERPGLLSDDEVVALVDRAAENTGGVSRNASRAVAWSRFPYQINSTYFEVLGRDEERYLLARLFQLMVPGVPQLYYVGLLAGSNDTALLARTGVGRDVNRHFYAADELAQALERPVVKALLAAVRWRAAHPAFAGDCRTRAEGSTLRLEWRAGAAQAALAADFAAGSWLLTWSDGAALRTARSARELAASFPASR